MITVDLTYCKIGSTELYLLLVESKYKPTRGVFKILGVDEDVATDEYDNEYMVLNSQTRATLFFL